MNFDLSYLFWFFIILMAPRKRPTRNFRGRNQLNGVCVVHPQLEK